MSVLADITEAADDLSEPHQHRARIREFDHNRNPKVRVHITRQPGLLTQLYQSVIPAGTHGGSGAATTPGSRPPLALEALSRHVSIVAGINNWCWTLDLTIRPTPESNLRALVGAAPTLDPDAQRALLADLRRWRRWCAVLTGWETLWRPAKACCPVIDCGKPSSLRINLTAQTGMCQACGATWTADDGSLTILAEHIAATTNAA